MKHVTETYACDRCKAPLAHPGGPKDRYPRLHLKGSVNGEWSGWNFEWSDLCVSCWTAIHEFLGKPAA